MKRWLLRIIITAILWGAIGVFAKIILQYMSPIELTRWRFLFATGSILPFIIWHKSKVPTKISKNKRGQAILISLFATGNIILFAYGVEQTTAMIAQLLYVLTPIIVIFLSYIFYQQVPKKSIYIWVGTGLIGALLVIFLPVIQGAEPLSTGTFTGNIIITVAVLSFSCYLIFSKQQNMYKHFSPVLYNTIYIVTTFLALSLAIIRQWSVTNLTQLPREVWAMLIYTWVIGTTLYYLGYQYLIKHFSAMYASLIQYIQPIAVIIRAIILLSEKLTFLFILGMLLSIWWVYLINKQQNK